LTKARGGWRVDTLAIRIQPEKSTMHDSPDCYKGESGNRANALRFAANTRPGELTFSTVACESSARNGKTILNGLDIIVTRA